jgi:hypothetical protein
MGSVISYTATNVFVSDVGRLTIPHYQLSSQPEP